MFEIFSRTDISDRFDKSDDFWKKFGVHCPQNQKVLGLYEVEHIDGPCYVTLAVNSKEYFEYFKSDNENKKLKGIKKRFLGMEYENYAERIKLLFDFNTFQKPKHGSKEVVCISVKNGEMTTHKIVETKFSQLNDKRFYFPNGILSLPYGHPLLKDIDEYKKKQGSKDRKVFLKRKGEPLRSRKKST